MRSGGDEAAERDSMARRKGHEFWSHREWVLVTSCMSEFLSSPGLSPLICKKGGITEQPLAIINTRYFIACTYTVAWGRSRRLHQPGLRLQGGGVSGWGNLGLRRTKRVEVAAVERGTLQAAAIFQESRGPEVGGLGGSPGSLGKFDEVKDTE